MEIFFQCERKLWRLFVLRGWNYKLIASEVRISAFDLLCFVIDEGKLQKIAQKQGAGFEIG